MKKFIIISAIAIAFCGQASAQRVQRANVYFENNSAGLTANVAGLLDTIYKKLPEGKTIRIGLVGNGEDFSMTRYSDERFDAVKKYLVSKNVKPEFIHYEKTASGGEAVIEKEIPFTAKNFTGLDKYFTKNIQSYSITPGQENTIKGAKGTEITFPADAFLCADGSAPDGKIRIELQEFYGKGDLLRSNLHTMSGSNILESGGTVHVAAFCGTEEAQLAYGAEISLAFPTKDYKDGMQTFNGFTGEVGGLDWVASGEEGITQSQSQEQYFDPETEQYYNVDVLDGMYIKNENGMDKYLLSSGSLGWINCDRFIDDPREKMDIIVDADTSLHPAIRIVFKDIQAVMSGYDNGTGKVTFTGIPKGSEINIVAYSVVDKKPYMAIKSIVVDTNSEEKIALAATTKQWMERELLSLK